MAAKAVALGEALQPAFKTYAQQIIDNMHAMVAGFKEDEHLRLISDRAVRQSWSLMSDAGCRSMGHVD